MPINERVNMIEKYKEMKKKIELLETPYIDVADYLNKLRNAVAHDRHKVDKKEIVNAFLCIAFILSRGKLPHCIYSIDFHTFINSFCDKILPSVSGKLKKAELERESQQKKGYLC